MILPIRLSWVICTSSNKRSFQRLRIALVISVPGIFMTCPTLRPATDLIAFGSLKKTPTTSMPPISSSSTSPYSIGVVFCEKRDAGVHTKEERKKIIKERYIKLFMWVYKLSGTETYCKGGVLFKRGLVRELFTDSAKAALPVLEVNDGSIEIFSFKIRPVHI